MKHLMIIPALALVLFIGACKKKKAEDKTISCDPGTTNLKANFKFSSNLSDESGNITTATSTSLTYGADKNGTASAAASFSGASKIAMPSVFDKNKRTFSLWFKTTTYPSGSFPNDMGIILNYDFPSLSYGFVVAAVMKKAGVNTLKMQIGNNVTLCEVDLDALGTAQAWNHMVIVQDGNSANFYVNGKLIIAASIPAYVVSVDGMQSLFLGTQRNDNGRYFDGSIDQFRFYDRALSACEVEYLYNNY